MSVEWEKQVWPAQQITSNERTQMTDCSYNRLLLDVPTHTHLLTPYIRTKTTKKTTHPTPVHYCVEHPK